MQLCFVDHLQTGAAVDSALLHGALQLLHVLGGVAHQHLAAALEREVQLLGQLAHDPVAFHAAFCLQAAGGVGKTAVHHRRVAAAGLVADVQILLQHCNAQLVAGQLARDGTAHDARTDEDNEYNMIFTKGEDGKFTAIDGYSAEYEADQLNEEIRDILMPPLNLEDGQYTAFAASISSMMVRSYAVAIVKPAEGKTDEVKAALEAYVASEQQSMEHYLEDQYLVAKAATVTVAPTGEVVLVCAEDHDTILANIEKALAA